MKNKELFKIIVIITILLLGLLLIVKRGTKYNKLIINEDKWNNIISSRKESLDHLIDKITFNEYRLFLDEDNNTLYYSMIENNKSSYNPKVYTKNKVSIATKEKIDDEGIKNNHLYELLVYNDEEYEIYNLKVTRIPIISINYSNNKNKNIPIEFYLFDNYSNTTKRVITSKGYISKDNDTNYSLSLTMESLGRNERENNESLLRMKNHSEYYLSKTDNYYIKDILGNYLYNSLNNISDSYQYVELFINNEYLGLYTLGYKLEKEYLNLNQDDFIYLKNDNDYEFYNNEFKRIKSKNEDKEKELEEYNKVLESEDINKIKDSTNMDNAINTYLFYLLTQSSNNIVNTYLVFNKDNNSYKVSFYPRTYGELFNKEYNYNDIKNNPVTILINLKDADTINKIKDLYKELRDNKWSLDSINKVIDDNSNKLLLSGKKIDNINEFKEYIKNRLNSLDEYINNL